MGFPKLPTVGGIKVEISPTGSTSDLYDGTAKTNTKRHREIEKTMTPRDERDIDPKTIKRERDEKNLQAAKNIKIGEQQGGNEVKTVANQQAQIVRQMLEKQIKDK